MDSFDHFGVGIIGYGIGKVYATAFRNVNNYYSDLPPVSLVGIATQSQASGERAARQFGFQIHTTDYHELLDSDAINVIVIATPNHLHYPMLIDCLRSAKRKAIYVDKPLTNTLQQASEVLSLARETGRDGQVIFEIRYCPALQYAYQLIKSGRLGELYSFRGYYFRSSYSDPARPLRWKASAAESGTGALGDLAAHVIDLICWLAGNPVDLSAQMRTFVDSRPEGSGAQSMTPVETDDHVILLVRLANGAIGTLEAGRMITGAMNDMGLEIYGSRASMRWNLMDANNLYLSEQSMPAQERGWLQIPTLQRYAEAVLPGGDVPAGLMRYHIASAADFLRHTLRGQTYEPGLLDGTWVQAVIDAAQAAVHSGTWQNVPQPIPSSSSLAGSRQGSTIGER